MLSDIDFQHLQQNTPDMSNESVHETMQPLLQQNEQPNNNILKCRNMAKTTGSLESSRSFTSLQTPASTTQSSKTNDSQDNTSKCISFPF